MKSRHFDKMEIVVDPHSFYMSATGSITGIVWVSNGAVDFPGKAWSDFPVVILSWWCDQTNELTGVGSSAKFLFMDGPFEIQMISEGASSLRVQFIERDNSSERLGVFTTSIENWNDALRAAIATTLAECERRGWSTSDTERLRTSAVRWRN
jgi:hypothetical protein